MIKSLLRKFRLYQRCWVTSHDQDLLGRFSLLREVSRHICPEYRFKWPQKGLVELFRVVEPGGMVLISTPFAFPVHGTPYDFRRWTPAGLEAEPQAAGFELESSIACGSCFSSLTVNFHLALRFHIMKGGAVFLRHFIAFLLPLILVMQGVMNFLALILDGMDRSEAFPLTLVVLARKPKGDR